MIGRIIPYSEVFIAVTFTPDEALAVHDLVGSLKAHRDPAVQKTAKDLVAVLEENLERAAAYKARKAT